MSESKVLIADRDVRQRGLVPPERLARCHPLVVGVGAIGRQVALQLAALGASHLTLFDDDVVQPENLAVDQMTALQRHAQGDWGELDSEDWAENELSLKEGFRLFSVYRSAQGVKFWIITEADRSATTLLLPSEY